MSIKIIFFSSWSLPGLYLKNTINILTPNNDGKWDNIIGTDNVDEADYYIILDEETKQSINLPNNKKIYLQREPRHYKKIHSNLNDYFFQGTYQNFYHVGVPWILKSFDFLKDFEYNKRNKKLVTLCSNK